MTEPVRAGKTDPLVPAALDKAACAKLQQGNHSSEAVAANEVPASDLVATNIADLSTAGPASYSAPPPLSETVKASARFVAEFPLFPGVEVLRDLPLIQQMTEPSEVFEPLEFSDDGRFPADQQFELPEFNDPVDEPAESADLPNLGPHEDLPDTDFADWELEPAPETRAEDESSDVSEVAESPVSESPVSDAWIAEASEEKEESPVAASTIERRGSDDVYDDDDEDWTAEQPDERLLFVSTRCKNCRAHYRFRIAEKLQFACRECGELCTVRPSVTGRLKQWLGDRLKPGRRG